MKQGTLYLIPSTLGNNDLELTIPAGTGKIINQIDEFITENIKTAQVFLKRAGFAKSFETVVFHLLNKDTQDKDTIHYLDAIAIGKNMGLLSEAGCPCIADPGAKIAASAQRKNIKIVPLTGPSSITLALMASGFDGQKFCFNGYLPIEREKRKQEILRLEKIVASTGITQLFIEAPHRNNHMIEDIAAVCMDGTKLCIAADITLAKEMILTKTIEEWKKHHPDLKHRPAIFILGK
jgi:16S rRNA (cytidine1402-2'-O)-methyltransferase